MTSKVTLRKPRNPSSGTSSSGQIGRPKSWTEFNTRYQALSSTVNIDLSPVPKMEEQTVKKRERSGYRKVRPLSSSILEQQDGKLKIQNRPTSPKYTSFMVPNPWRNSVPKVTISDASTTRELSNQNKETEVNYDDTTHHYHEIKNVRKPQMTVDNSPPAEFNIDAQKVDKTDHLVQNFGQDSDSDSTDSAVVSGGSTPHGTSSEKSPKWRYRNPDSTKPTKVDDNSEEASETTNPDSVKARDNRSWNRSPEHPVIQVSAASATLSPPRAVQSSSRQLVEMEFFPDDDVIRFEESSPRSYDMGRSIVPSPLKSCYTENTAYDALVEISDSENSSGEENSEVSRSNTNTSRGYYGDRSADEYMPRTTPKALPRQSSLLGARTDVQNGDYDVADSDVREKHYDARSGTWPRRKPKKKDDAVDVDKLMEDFKKARENHLSKFKSIYEDSRKRIDDVMENLKRTMAENGYLEWYPKIR